MNWASLVEESRSAKGTDNRKERQKHRALHCSKGSCVAFSCFCRGFMCCASSQLYHIPPCEKFLKCDEMVTQLQTLQVSQQSTVMSPLVKLVNDQFVWIILCCFLKNDPLRCRCGGLCLSDSVSSSPRTSRLHFPEADDRRGYIAG